MVAARTNPLPNRLRGGPKRYSLIGADMSNDKLWQDMTPDEQANEIHQIKTWLLRIAEGLNKLAEKVNAIEDKLSSRH
jgi:hypothetical protein